MGHGFQPRGDSGGRAPRPAWPGHSGHGLGCSRIPCRQPETVAARKISPVSELRGTDAPRDLGHSCHGRHANRLQGSVRGSIGDRPARDRCLHDTRNVQPEPHPEIRLVFAGSLYAKAEWNCFVKALSSAGWMFGGRKVVVCFMGRFPLKGADRPKEAADHPGRGGLFMRR